LVSLNPVDLNFERETAKPVSLSSFKPEVIAIAGGGGVGKM
jgi:ABC-type histidine transport system ATPase subunit